MCAEFARRAIVGGSDQPDQSQPPSSEGISISTTRNLFVSGRGERRKGTWSCPNPFRVWDAWEPVHRRCKCEAQPAAFKQIWRPKTTFGTKERFVMGEFSIQRGQPQLEGMEIGTIRSRIRHYFDPGSLLSSKCRTHKTVKARFWPLLSGKGP